MMRVVGALTRVMRQCVTCSPCAAAASKHVTAAAVSASHPTPSRTRQPSWYIATAKTGPCSASAACKSSTTASLTALPPSSESTFDDKHMAAPCNPSLQKASRYSNFIRYIVRTLYDILFEDYAISYKAGPAASHSPPTCSHSLPPSRVSEVRCVYQTNE
jgi:hypothetical protein